jgi:hypothetical protein
MPLQARSELILSDPYRATWLEPEKWPEVRMAIAGFRDAVKKPKLAIGSFGTDAGVKRLVELYAAGMTAEDVCTALPLVVASPWWTNGEGTRDLGSISLTVARRALSERKPAATSVLQGLPQPMFGGGS